jgi:ubiquinol oxidase
MMTSSIPRKDNNMSFSDKVAYGLTMSFRWFADTFFAKRYGHRAVVLETVAGVPGMVAGMWNHLRSLRKMQPDERGWIKTLLDEAENERMHLMIFIEIAQPNWLERYLILLAQFFFWNFYFVLYVFFPQTAHRMVGYFEDQAVISYTQYLEEIDAGRTENIPAPQVAIDYYNLAEDATLRDVVIAVRADEQGHADVNHDMANQLLTKHK